MNRQGVVALQRRWPGVMPLSDAARLLGVTEPVLANLVETEIIRTAPAAKARAKASSLKIEMRSLADLIDQLRQVPVRYLYSQQLETVPLSTLSENGADTVDILQRVLAGEIRAYWPPDATDLAHLVVVAAD